MATGLIILQLIVSVVAVLLVWFQGISTPHCSNRCDFTTLYWAGVGFAIAAGALWIAATICTVALRKRGRWIIAPPIVGLLLTIVGAIIATQISRAAMLF